MGLGRSAAVVIGSFPLGESDRVVTFFARDLGRVRGVARAARRLRSRFGGALELFTLGQLVFFDTGRSELVRIDHFDVTHPFVALRERLDTLGEAAWVVEIVARTTGERDRQPALYGLLVRALRALETAARPARAFNPSRAPYHKTTIRQRFYFISSASPLTISAPATVRRNSNSLMP